MAKVSNVGTRIYLDEFALSGFLNTFDLSIVQELAPSVCFSDVGPRRLVGNYDHKHGSNGFFDAATGGLDQLAFVDLNTDEDHYLGEYPGSDAEAGVGYESIVRLTEQPRSGGVGAAVLLNLSSEGSGEGSGGLARATVLANATVVAAGNRTGRNMGATTLGQVFAVVFRVLAFTGTNITLKVQESSDNAGADPYADITGLTSGALTGVGVVRATTSAATEAWKRVNIAGTFTSATILVTAGVVAGT